MLLCLANIGDVLADIFKFVYTKVCCCGCCRRKDRTKDNRESPQGKETPEAWKANIDKCKDGGPVIVDDDDEEEEEEEDDNFSVPLTVTMSVIAIYILLGAAMFGPWEGWVALDAAYFSFVTVSTIGFGDYSPGTSKLANTSGQLQLLMGAVYMVFGLALLSMCFSLIQEEIATKFKWAGEKLGLVAKDADGESDDEEEEEEEKEK